ncbi:MAG: hypothetical protein ABIC57_02350 [bacterium]
MIGVSVSVMGYLGKAMEKFQLGPKGAFGHLSGFQELYLRTASGNIYQIKMLPDEFDLISNKRSPIALFNGCQNASLGDVAKGYILSDEERHNLLIELGKSLYVKGGNTSEIIEIVAVDTCRTYFDFAKRTQGLTNSIRTEFYELLYPGQADKFTCHWQ